MILFCVSFIIYTLDEMSSRLLCRNESDAAFAGSGAKSYDEWMEQLNASYGLDKPIVPVL